MSSSSILIQGDRTRAQVSFPASFSIVFHLCRPVCFGKRLGFSVFEFLCYTYEMRLLVEVLLHFWEMIKGVQTEWQYKWEASSREK